MLWCDGGVANHEKHISTPGSVKEGGSEVICGVIIKRDSFIDDIQNRIKIAV